MDRMIRTAVCTVLLLFLACTSAEEATMDPNDISLNGHVHSELPESLLDRIRSTTDILEEADGVSYERAVDLYRRDVDPESNLVIFEEIARVYADFCRRKCTTAELRLDVFRVLLVRSMYPADQVLQQLDLSVLKGSEAEALISNYSLSAVPISVFQQP